MRNLQSFESFVVPYLFLLLFFCLLLFIYFFLSTFNIFIFQQFDYMGMIFLDLSLLMFIEIFESVNLHLL